jgi:hypothetical protein
MSRRYFTNREIKFLIQNFVRHGPVYCAEKLGRNIPYVAKKAYALGLKRKISDQWRIDKSPKQINMEPFHHITEPSIAYLLGFIWADGHVTKKKNGIIIHIQNCDGKNLKNLFFNYNFHLHISKRGQYVFYLNDYLFHKFLADNDYVIKSTASPSKILAHVPDHLRHYFFRGYFDGDGCLTNNSNHCLSFTGSYEQDWSDVKKMIKKITNHHPKICRRNNDIRGHRSSYIYIYGKEKVRAVLRYLYRGKQMGLRRKAHPSQQFLTNLSS